MECSNEPLLDVSKFPFFGGTDCHRWTDSLMTFVMPCFAKNLAAKYPIVAGLLKKFNDDFNQHLIMPSALRRALGKPLEPEEETRFTDICEKFQHSDSDAIREYSKAVVEDGEIFSKIRKYKHTTLLSMAYGGCDSPLCDQLLFLYEWLMKNESSSLKVTEGFWNFDKAKGFTSVVQEDNGMFRAKQPVLVNPKDEELLVRMRDALETYLMQHLNVHSIFA